MACGTRADLNRSGALCAESTVHGSGFAELLRASAQNALVVYDGVRLAAALEQLKRMFSSTLSIYLDTSIDIRRVRYLERGENLDFDEQERNELRMGDRAIRAQADVLLVGAAIVRFSDFLRFLPRPDC